MQQGAVSGRVCCAIRLAGPLQGPVLTAALRRLIERHEILHTSFQRLPGMKFPVQVVGAARLALAHVQLTELPADEQQAAIERLFAEAGQRSFDPAQEAAPQFTLLRLAEQEHLLFVVLPALCADARTLHNLTAELAQLYAGTGADGGPLDEPVQYVQYSEWQNELLADATEQQGRAYWARQELSAPVASKLPFELQPAQPVFAPAAHVFDFEPAVLRQLTNLAAQHNTTLAVLLLACWHTLLWQQTRAAEIVISCLFDGRKYEELHGALGQFARYLPIHMQLAAHTQFNRLVRQLDEALQEAAQWQEYFDWSQQRAPTSARNSAERGQLFAFEYMEAAAPHTAGGISFSIVRQQVLIERAKVKLGFLGRAETVRAEMQYDPSYVTQADAVRLCAQYQRLVQSVLRTPRTAISRLEILSADERHQLLYEFNDTRAAYPAKLCFQQLFEAQVARTPEAVAVVFEAERVSYQELNRRANQLARYLRRLGVGPEQRVALVLERSLDMLVALLGVLKAGGAYVPLEPVYPPARLALMLMDVNATAVLTQQQLVEKVSAQTAQVVCLDSAAAQIAQESEANLAVEACAANLAYVIYTSGSTGQPKGVAVEHRQLANYLAAIQPALALPAPASYALVSTLAADLGHTMLFPALCQGSTLHLIAQERATDAAALAAYFARERIDCLKIVPSHLAALLPSAQPAQVLPRQRLILGGEACQSEWVAHLQALAPNCRIFNHYGPTETTVGVLTGEVTPTDSAPSSESSSEAFSETLSGTLALGRPLGNTQVYLLDEAGQLVPLGVAGEVYVGGAQVARGYLHDPAQTAARFVPDPFSGVAGARLYRTGDRARYLAAGRLEFVGRVDRQVKLRGYRVELGEVEAALRELAEVREAVVEVRAGGAGNERLVAYVVAAGRAALSLTELRRVLSGRLPDYMLPAAFVLLEAWPVTANGKLDRRALPAPDETRSDLTRTHIAPRTPLEEALAAMWSEVLGLEQVGVQDNFFELGGHSLLAMRIISRLRETFHVELPLRVLFEATTIEQLAQALTAHEQKPGQTENIARVLRKIKSMSAADIRAMLEAKKTAQSL
jgi:amino acid adenylation domain-containing protein